MVAVSRELQKTRLDATQDGATLCLHLSYTLKYYTCTCIIAYHSNIQIYRSVTITSQVVLSPYMQKHQAFTAFGPTVVKPTWFLARTVYEKAGPFSEEGKVICGQYCRLCLSAHVQAS